MKRRCRECLDNWVLIKSDRGKCRNNRCRYYNTDRPLSEFERVVIVPKQHDHLYTHTHRVELVLNNSQYREQVQEPVSTPARQEIVPVPFSKKPRMRWSEETSMLVPKNDQPPQASEERPDPSKVAGSVLGALGLLLVLLGLMARAMQ